jgi:hypothetical protein
MGTSDNIIGNLVHVTWLPPTNRFGLLQAEVLIVGNALQTQKGSWLSSTCKKQVLAYFTAELQMFLLSTSSMRIWSNLSSAFSDARA